MNKDRVVLFYPTGVVHFRNLEVMKQHTAGYRFKVIIEPWVPATAAEVLETIAEEDRVIVKDNRVSRDVWDEVNVLFLSMAYPNPFRLGLVYEACKRNIPVMAIEEVNQLALNDGIINHYFLPLDYFGVPSDVEVEKFLELGLKEETLMVTGWPFFNREPVLAADNHSDFHIKEEYDIPDEKKCCLLVLGSLKEFDIVSLETRRVRRHILEVVSGGLTEEYQLLIKPHPIETETALQEIREQAPDAILLKPKHRIEPLLEQSDLVVNRGNSQVTLLAMLQKKNLIVAPAGLNTIFHGHLDEIVADSPEQFRRILDKRFDYEHVVSTHFPLSQEEALEQVRELLANAVENGSVPAINRRLYISVLFAFLGDMARANQVLEVYLDEPQAQMLKPLYSGQIGVHGFRELLTHFPAPVHRWHLQALWVRLLSRHRHRPEVLKSAVELLEGFEGDVNPHYFIDDLVKRIELEYRAGRRLVAERLTGKLHDDYRVFDYYKEAFDMMHFTYGGAPGWQGVKKTFWLLAHITKSYTRKYIKDKFRTLP
jgi:hypothetical protein